jgi:hypothetical protein
MRKPDAGASIGGCACFVKRFRISSHREPLTPPAWDQNPHNPVHIRTIRDIGYRFESSGAAVG